MYLNLRTFDVSEQQQKTRADQLQYNIRERRKTKTKTWMGKLDLQKENQPRNYQMSMNHIWPDAVTATAHSLGNHNRHTGAHVSTPRATACQNHSHSSCYFQA